jgi:magnesium-transporting ATPase (P-type)
MKLASRILIAVFAVLAAIAWALLLLSLMHWGNAMAGMGDGAGTESRSLSALAVLIIAAVWLVPTTAFVFMFLSTLNLLQGVIRRVAYWYSLVFLIIAACALMVLYPGIHVFRLIGLAFMLFAGLWVYAFRGMKNAQDEPTQPQ